MVSLGLSAALKNKGLAVRAFKKGPDYIDPMWHRVATGADCFNLDMFLTGAGAVRETLRTRSEGFDFSLIEGNHGLHDGLDGTLSSAGMAKALGAPVILVMDATGMNRNLAAVVMGMQHFDREVQVAGVILNQVKTPRQQGKLVQAIEDHCGIPVLGSIPPQKKGVIEERHLGLVTTGEEARSAQIVEALGELVAENVDLDKILEIARGAPHLDSPSGLALRAPAKGAAQTPVRIAVAFDPAFCFYYPENFEALKAEGAELVFFNAMQAPALPPCDGLYLVGGFPETHLAALAANKSLLADVGKKVRAGLPAYAECGGLVYLAREVEWAGETFQMAGVIEADVEFSTRPAGYGYVEFEPTGEDSWLKLEKPARGHEFHYSQFKSLPPDARFLYRMERGTGLGRGVDGLLLHNLLASYTHIHQVAFPNWSKNFVEFVRKKQNS